MSFGILLIYGIDLNDRIISQRREAWAHKTKIPLSNFLLNCLYQARKVSGRVCVCVLGMLCVCVFFYFASISTVF